MAIVPIAELVRALPYVVILGIVPGLALVTAIAPRLSWPQCLASAPGLSVGFVGVAGLLLRTVHVGFSPAPMLPILAALVVAAILRRRGSRPESATPHVSLGWRVTAVSLISGLVLICLVAADTHDEALPSSTDPPVHASVAAAISRDGDVLPVIPMPLVESGAVRTHDAFEITDALLSEVGAGDPAVVMLPLALVSLLLLPLGVALLAFEALPDRRIAAMAALFALGFTFPALAVGSGDYPWIVDSTLVVPLILAGARLLRGRAWREDTAILGTVVLAMWVIHGLEVVSTVVMGGSLWVSILWLRRRSAIRGAVLGLAAFVLAAGVGYILTRAPYVGVPSTPSSVPSGADAYLALQRQGGIQLTAVLDEFGVTDLSLFSGVLLMIGMVVLFLRRRARWLLVSLLVPLVCLVDVAGPQLLYRLWLVIWPWSEWDRLLGIEFFAGPIISAVGAVALIDPLRGVRAHSSRRLWALSMALVAVGAAALGDGASRSWQIIESWQSPAHERVAASDVAVINGLGRSVKPGTLILNDGSNDSGQWIDALVPDVEAEPKAYSDSYPDDWRVRAIASSCTDPAGAKRALIGVGAIFVGSGELETDGLTWSPPCIAKVPGVHLVAGSLQGPAGFVVTP